MCKLTVNNIVYCLVFVKFLRVGIYPREYVNEKYLWNECILPTRNEFIVTNQSEIEWRHELPSQILHRRK